MHSRYQSPIFYSVLPRWMQRGLIIETEVVQEFHPFMDRLFRHGDYKWALSYSA